MLFSDVAVTKYAKTTTEVEKVIHFWFKDNFNAINVSLPSEAIIMRSQSEKVWHFFILLTVFR